MFLPISLEIKTRTTRSECPLHDIALNDICKAFEAKTKVQSYYRENVLQTRTDFRDNDKFQPFIELNIDAMADVNTKVGIFNLAIEFDTTNKNNSLYRRKINTYYRKQKIDGLLYICANWNLTGSTETEYGLKLEQAHKEEQCQLRVTC